jgi:hypothetical protein
VPHVRLLKDASPALVGVGCQSGISRRLQNDVFSLKGCVLNGSEDIFPFEKRIISKDFFKGRSGTQEMQHIRHPDAQAANAWPASAFARLDGNPLK